MHNILHDTPVYQEILKEGRQEGLEQGLEQGLERGRQALRQAVVSVVLERFPKLARLAKKQVAVVEDATILQHVLVKISVAASMEEAQRHLLALDEEDGLN